jgi:hypothetical protein
MARTRAKNRKRIAFTDDERAAYADAAQRRREDAYAALLTDDGWEAFLKARLLHRYSWRNCALIAAQAPEAIQVATYRQWVNYGAQVREGQHPAARICIRKQTGGFGTCAVFDVTQTDAALELSEADAYPEGFADALQTLSAAVSRPATLDQVQDAGNAIERAYRAQEGTNA